MQDKGFMDQDLKVREQKSVVKQMVTHLISSGLYSDLHLNVSFIILVAFFTFQFRALKYLAIDASEQ